MTKNQFLSLLQKYLNGEASKGEQNLLHAYYDLFIADPDVLELLNAEERAKLGKQLKIGIDQHITSKAEPFRWKALTWIAAAVAVIIFGLWFFKGSSLRSMMGTRNDIVRSTEVIPGQSAAIPGTNDVSAGGRGATLKLIGGDSIFLSTVKNAVHIAENLSYDDGSGVDLDLAGSDRAVPMSICTGKGQNYQMVLADGTKVWLNAGSQLEFPSSFEGSKSRTVKFSGEGYFEVSADRVHPFIIQSPSQQLEVLGTRFNIRDYFEQSSAVTSVLEGSVQIRPMLESAGGQQPISKNQNNNKPITLKAGQQFVLNKDFQRLLKVDEKAALAWKMGNFYFNNENILEVMDRIAYWYDVEIVYVNEKRRVNRLTGMFSKRIKLSEVLHILNVSTGLEFRIEGRKVYVE